MFEALVRWAKAKAKNANTAHPHERAYGIVLVYYFDILIDEMRDMAAQHDASPVRMLQLFALTSQWGES